MLLAKSRPELPRLDYGFPVGFEHLFSRPSDTGKFVSGTREWLYEPESELSIWRALSSFGWKRAGNCRRRPWPAAPVAGLRRICIFPRQTRHVEAWPWGGPSHDGWSWQYNLTAHTVWAGERTRWPESALSTISGIKALNPL